MLREHASSAFIFKAPHHEWIAFDNADVQLVRPCSSSARVFLCQKCTPALCGEASFLPVPRACLYFKSHSSVVRYFNFRKYSSRATQNNKQSNNLPTTYTGTIPILQKSNPSLGTNQKRSSGGAVFHNSRTGWPCRTLLAAMLWIPC